MKSPVQGNLKTDAQLCLHALSSISIGMLPLMDRACQSRGKFGIVLLLGIVTAGIVTAGIVTERFLLLMTAHSEDGHGRRALR